MQLFKALVIACVGMLGVDGLASNKAVSLEKIWPQVDLNSDGQVDAKEFGEYLARQATEEDTKTYPWHADTMAEHIVHFEKDAGHLISLADENRDNKLEISEFAKVASGLPRYMVRRNAPPPFVCPPPPL
jgi:hypothetical protein